MMNITIYTLSKQIANYHRKRTQSLPSDFFTFILCYSILGESEVQSLRSRVKWFKDEKGYGFLKYTDTEDIFVHYSSIIQNGYKSLKKDEEVEFDLVKTEKGYQAANTKKIEHE